MKIPKTFSIFQLICSSFLISLVAGCQDDQVSFRRKDDIASAARELPEALKAYKAAGLPWVASDVVTSISNDDQLNAASYLLTAQQTLDSEPLTKVDPGTSVSMFWRRSEKLKQLELNPELKNVLGLLFAASLKPNFDFHFDWTYGGWQGTDPVDVPLLLKLLSDEAEHEAKLGHGKQAALFINQEWNLVLLTGDSPPFANPNYFKRLENALTSVEKCGALMGSVPTTSIQAARTSFTNQGQMRYFASNASSRGGAGFDRTNLVNALPQGSPPPLNVAPTSRIGALNEFIANLHLPNGHASLVKAARLRIFSEIGKTRQLDGNVGSESDKSELRQYSPDDLPTTPRGSAELTRELQFWAANKSSVGNLDRDPVRSGHALDSALSLAKMEGSSSTIDIRATPRDFEDLGAAQIKIYQLRDVELYLLDTLNFRRRTGRLPHNLSELSANRPSDARLITTGDNFQIQATGSDSSALSRARGPDPLFDVAAGQQGYSQDSSSRPRVGKFLPVIACYPPLFTEEEVAIEKDEQQIAGVFHDDFKAASSNLDKDFSHYLACGLPVASHNSPPNPNRESLDNQVRSQDPQLETSAKIGASNEDQAIHSSDVKAIYRMIEFSASSEDSDPNLTLANCIDLFDGKAATDTEILHFCVFRLINLDCSTAETEAKLGHGAKSATQLNNAWQKLNLLKDEPIRKSCNAYALAIQAIGTSIEISSALLYPTYPEFLSYKRTLQCRNDPVSVKDEIIREIPAQWSSLTTSKAPGASLPSSKSSGVLPTGVLEKGSLARLLEFWIENKPLLDHIDTNGAKAAKDLLIAKQVLNARRGKSYQALTGLVTDTESLFDLVLSYEYRNAELILLQALTHRHDFGMWPKTLSEVALTTFDGEGWHLTSDGKKFQIEWLPNAPGSNSITPLEIQRQPLDLNSPIVASYPPLKNFN